MQPTSADISVKILKNAQAFGRLLKLCIPRFKFHFMEALINTIEALYDTWSLLPRIYWYLYSKVYDVRLHGSLHKLLRLSGGFPFYVPYFQRCACSSGSLSKRCTSKVDIHFWQPSVCIIATMPGYVHTPMRFCFYSTHTL